MHTKVELKNNIKEHFKVVFCVKCRLQYSLNFFISLLEPNLPKNTSLNYAMNMQHKVFMSLFVVQLCVAALSVPPLLSSYCFLFVSEMCVCKHAHGCLQTQTPMSPQPHTEGGPWSWPQLLCVSLLTHYVWQSTALLLSCCLLCIASYIICFLSANTNKMSLASVWVDSCGMRGSVHLFRASENRTGCQFAFSSPYPLR